MTTPKRTRKPIGVICENVGTPDRRCISVTTNPGCDPRCGEHPHPTGYIAHSEWAETMLETHEQRQCPGCGLWTIWEPKTEPAIPKEPQP